MEDIEAINEMFPDELLSDAEFEKALDELCANPDDEFKRELTEMMSEHQLITWEEAEQILGDTGDEPVKSSLPQQTRPTEPDNDTNVEDTIQRLLQNDPGLVQVNLNNMKRTPIPKIKRIIEAMRQNQFVEQLSLANMGLYDHDVMNLIESVEDNESLKKLNLETNYLSGEFFAKLFAAVNKNQAVEEVKAVNQGMNFSTTAERDIIKAIKDNYSLTKVSMNIRLPELRNKIQQITMRNQEIRRIMRKRAADEQKALEEQKRLEEEEKARKKAEVEKAKQPLKVFPKEMLQYNRKKEESKKEEPKKPEEQEVRASISKIVAEKSILKKYDQIDSPSPQSKGMAPMILGDPVPDTSESKGKNVRNRLNQLGKKDATEDKDKNSLAAALEKKPVLKKLPSLDPNPIVSKPNPAHKMETKNWPPKPKDKAEPEKPQPKKNPLVSKWESGETEERHRLDSLDDLTFDTESSENEAPATSSKENSGKFSSKFKKPSYDTPLSPASISIMSMDMDVKPKTLTTEKKLPSKIVSPFLTKPKDEKDFSSSPKKTTGVTTSKEFSKKKTEPIKPPMSSVQAKSPLKNPIEPEPVAKFSPLSGRPTEPAAKDVKGSVAKPKLAPAAELPTTLKKPVQPQIPTESQKISETKTKLLNNVKSATPSNEKHMFISNPKPEHPKPRLKLLSPSAESPIVSPQSNPSKILLSPSVSNDSTSAVSDSSALSATSESELKVGTEKPKRKKRIVKRIVRRRKKKDPEGDSGVKEKENVKNGGEVKSNPNGITDRSRIENNVVSGEKGDNTESTENGHEPENMIGGTAGNTKDGIKHENDFVGNRRRHDGYRAPSTNEEPHIKDEVLSTLPKPSLQTDYTSHNTTGSSYSSRNRLPYRSGLNRYSKY